MTFGVAWRGVIKISVWRDAKPAIINWGLKEEKRSITWDWLQSVLRLLPKALIAVKIIWDGGNKRLEADSHALIGQAFRRALIEQCYASHHLGFTDCLEVL